MDNETKTPTTMPKQHDIVDYTLTFSFVVLMVVICLMSYQGKEIPDFLKTIFFLTASGLGFYKATPVKLQ